MTPARAALAERLVVLVGFVLIVVAIAAYDLRLGLLAAGALLVISTLDMPRRRP